MAFLNLRPRAEQTAQNIPDLKRLAVQTAFHILHGQNPQRRSGSGDTFWQFREYSTGDMPRDIDWRQSAKTERIYIRQKEQHTAQSCLFWLKQNADMAFQSEGVPYSKKDNGAVLALSLALLHSRMGEMIGFAGRQRPGHSEKTLGELEQLLMQEKQDALPASLEIPKHSAFYAISDFLEPPEEIESAFAPLAARTRSGWFIHVLDPAELELPYQGRIIFEDTNGANRHLVNNAVDIRADYQQRVDDHVKTVQALCTKWGWHYILHVSGRPFEDTALKIWLENAS